MSLAGAPSSSSCTSANFGNMMSMVLPLRVQRNRATERFRGFGRTL
jgi:hypothetical protein